MYKDDSRHGVYKSRNLETTEMSHNRGNVLVNYEIKTLSAFLTPIVSSVSIQRAGYYRMYDVIEEAGLTVQLSSTKSDLKKIWGKKCKMPLFSLFLF